MQKIDIHDAKTQFSKLVDAASNGDEIIIAKAGKPAAKVVPIRHAASNRRPGALKGKIKVSNDFDCPLPEDIQKAFEGS